MCCVVLFGFYFYLPVSDFSAPWLIDHWLYREKNSKALPEIAANYFYNTVNKKRDSFNFMYLNGIPVSNYHLRYTRTQSSTQNWKANIKHVNSGVLCPESTHHYVDPQ